MELNSMSHQLKNNVEDGMYNTQPDTDTRSKINKDGVPSVTTQWGDGEAEKSSRKCEPKDIPSNHETIEEIRDFVEAGSTSPESEGSQWHVLSNIMKLLEDDDESDEDETDIYENLDLESMEEVPEAKHSPSTCVLPVGAEVSSKRSNDETTDKDDHESDELKNKQHRLDQEETPNIGIVNENKVYESVTSSVQDDVVSDKDTLECSTTLCNEEITINKTGQVDTLVKSLNINVDTSNLSKNQLINKEHTIPESADVVVSDITDTSLKINIEQTVKQKNQSVPVLDKQTDGLDSIHGNVIYISSNDELKPPGLSLKPTGLTKPACVSPKSATSSQPSPTDVPRSYNQFHQIIHSVDTPKSDICESNFKIIPLVDLPLKPLSPEKSLNVIPLLDDSTKPLKQLPEQSLNVIPYVDDPAEPLKQPSEQSLNVIPYVDDPAEPLKQPSEKSCSGIPFLDNPTEPLKPPSPEQSLNVISFLDGPIESLKPLSHEKSLTVITSLDVLSKPLNPSCLEKKLTKVVIQDESNHSLKPDLKCSNVGRNPMSSDQRDSSLSDSSRSSRSKRSRGGNDPRSSERKRSRKSVSLEKKRSPDGKCVITGTTKSESETKHSGSKEPGENQNRSGSSRLPSPDSSDANPKTSTSSKYRCSDRMHRTSASKRSHSPGQKTARRSSPDSSVAVTKSSSSQLSNKKPQDLIELFTSVQPFLVDNFKKVKKKKREVSIRLRALLAERKELQVKLDELSLLGDSEDPAFIEVSSLLEELEMRIEKLKEIAENVSIQQANQDRLHSLLLKTRLASQGQATPEDLDDENEVETEEVMYGLRVEEGIGEVKDGEVQVDRSVKSEEANIESNVKENNTVESLEIEVVQSAPSEEQELEEGEIQDDEDEEEITIITEISPLKIEAVTKMEQMLKEEERLCRSSLSKEFRKPHASNRNSLNRIEKISQSHSSTLKDTFENETNREQSSDAEYCNLPCNSETNVIIEEKLVTSDIRRKRRTKDKISSQINVKKICTERLKEPITVDEENDAKEKQCGDEKHRSPIEGESSENFVTSERNNEVITNLKKENAKNELNKTSDQPASEEKSESETLTEDTSCIDQSSCATETAESDVVVAGWSSADIKMLKAEIQLDPLWGPVYRVKMNIDSPEDRTIALQNDLPEYFKIFKDLLWKSHSFSGDYSGKGKIFWRIVVPSSWSGKVLSFYHSDEVGHCDQSTMMAAISRDFFWIGVKDDISNFIENCNYCQNLGSTNFLTEVITGGPFYDIIIDIIGPLPKTRSGYEYIVGIIDIFSRFVRLFPIRRLTDETVTDTLEDYSLMYEYPRFVVTYDKSLYGSETFQNFCKLNNITHIDLRKPGNLQKMNRKVRGVVKQAASTKHGKGLKKWVLFLRKVERFINRSMDKKTGYIPVTIVMRTEMTDISGSWMQTVGGINIKEFSDVVYEWMDCLISISRRNLRNGDLVMTTNK